MLDEKKKSGEGRWGRGVINCKCLEFIE